MGITLPTEIITFDKTPRVAIAFDKTSGVKQTVDTAREVLLVGQIGNNGPYPVAENVPVIVSPVKVKFCGRSGTEKVMGGDPFAVMVYEKSTPTNPLTARELVITGSGGPCTITVPFMKG